MESMKKYSIILAICIAVILLAGFGCSKAQWSTMQSWGAKHKITLYSGGKVVKTYYSTGQVQEHEGGMVFFQDDDNKQPVYIYGTWTVEIDDGKTNAPATK